MSALNIMPGIMLLTAAGSRVGLVAFCQAEEARNRKTLRFSAQRLIVRIALRVAAG
jgi:hypothetical protein